MKRSDAGSTTLIVEGGHALTGVVDVEGNKNAALPLLAACLLTDRPCRLTNVPRIADVGVMVELLQGLGADIEGAGSSTLDVCCRSVTTAEPDPRLVGRLRGSVLLFGPLLARLGHARLAPPGGDFPARRTIAAHLQALRAMGAREVAGDAHELETPDGLHSASIYLEEASVTGTETALLAAAAARGTTEIRHAACEPHVAELCDFLRRMGVDIVGDGTSSLTINGGGAMGGASQQSARRLHRGGKLGRVGGGDGGHYRDPRCPCSRSRADHLGHDTDAGSLHRGGRAIDCGRV